MPRPDAHPGVPTLSVVIPVYNEARRIEATIGSIAAYLARSRISSEVLVSDDGSADGTPSVVARATQGTDMVRVLPAREHRGKGAAVRRGVLASRGDFVLITDADLSTPMSELPRLMQPVRLGADIAIASRGLRGSHLAVRQPLYREWSGRLFNALVRILLLPGIHDTQCGFKLMRGAVARHLFSISRVDGFAQDVEVLALAARAGLKIVEVPVTWAHNTDSKVRLARDAPAMLRDLLHVAVNVRAGGVAGLHRHAPSEESRTASSP